MKLEDIETVMRFMKTHGVTALKFGELELAMPLEPNQVEDKETEPTEDDLLFYSS